MPRVRVRAVVVDQHDREFARVVLAEQRAKGGARRSAASSRAGTTATTPARPAAPERTPCSICGRARQKPAEKNR